ncbi:HAD-superfamily hydrolase [Rivularia sp. IAM M-261]|nr:HAD-superfamily hydrolase [Rivularia sp. IAM M-261]
MIKAILFDLDGTLLDRDTSIQNFISNQYERLKSQLNKIPKKDYIKRFIELDCRGYVWKDKVYQSLVSEFEISTITWKELLSDYNRQFIYSCTPFPNLHQTLDTLLIQGYLLGIITNGLGVFQKRAIQGLGINRYFQTILISEVEGVRKPDVEIFMRASHNLNVTPYESVFIGDHPEVDILGASNAGMKSIWKRNSGWHEAQHADGIIDDLGEIPLLIKNIIRI